MSSPCETITTVQAVRALFGKGRGGSFRFKPMKGIRLFSILQSSVSSPATALNVASPFVLNSATFPELGSWYSIFEAARVTHVKIHWNVTSTVSPTAAYTAATSASSISFDSNSGAPGSIYGVMDNEWHQGIFTVPAFLATDASGMIPFRKFGAKVPSIAVPVGTEVNVGNAWFNTNSSAFPTAGVFQNYTSASGTSGVYTLQFMLEILMDFREHF